jgi:hypothetical protein
MTISITITITIITISITTTTTVGLGEEVKQVQAGGSKPTHVQTSLSQSLFLTP